MMSEFNLKKGPIDATQLAWYLFGNPIDDSDVGAIGRIISEQKKINRRITGVYALLWGVFLVLLGGLVDIVLRGGIPKP